MILCEPSPGKPHELRPDTGIILAATARSMWNMLIRYDCCPFNGPRPCSQKESLASRRLGAHKPQRDQIPMLIY
jgi:hypothetical protein